MNNKLLQRALGLLNKLLFIIILGVALLLTASLIQSRITGGVPTLAGNKLYTVISDSMNPAFRVGSVVLVKRLEASAVAPGDIITYADPQDSEKIVTHRVVAIYSAVPLSFITRGDANDANDPLPVPATNIIGRVTYAIPFVGYLFGFAASRTGLLLLIILPCVLVIASELRTLSRLAVAEQKNKEAIL